MYIRKALRKNKTPIKLEEVAEGVFVSYSDPLSDRPALGAIIGSQEVLMVDAGSSGDHAKSFVEELYHLAGKKPSRVCLTHWHWDHSFGLSSLALPAYAHRRCIARLSRLRNCEWTAEAINKRVLTGRELAFTRDMILAEYGESEEIRIGVPGNSIDDEFMLDLGNRPIHIRHLGSDHSDDSLTVYDEIGGALFLGDICHPDYYANPPHYTPRKVIELFNAINAVNATVILEGHEEPRSKTRFLSDYAPLRSIAGSCLAGERDRAVLFRLARDLSPSADPHETRAMIHAMLSGCA